MGDFNAPGWTFRDVINELGNDVVALEPCVPGTRLVIAVSFGTSARLGVGITGEIGLYVVGSSIACFSGGSIGSVVFVVFVVVLAVVAWLVRAEVGVLSCGVFERCETLGCLVKLAKLDKSTSAGW